MAHEQHLAILSNGVPVWNEWRRESYEKWERVISDGAWDGDITESPAVPDLSGANLERCNFTKIDFKGANLTRTILNDSLLENAELAEAQLSEANLTRVNMTNASMRRADFDRACLVGANLTCSFLSRAVLTQANLENANLFAANFDRASLQGAKLHKAVLRRANLTDANLYGADLSEADLRGTHLEWCRLAEADLSDSDLRLAAFSGATLDGAKFANSLLGETVFADVDLSKAIEIDRCRHNGPSIIDHRTLLRSGQLPLPFLRGIGFPEIWMEYATSFANAIQYYSCFISYSTKDQAFAERIYADLQNAGVRCWFAPHDMKSGDKIWDTIDDAIRLRDKVLLILSRDAVASDWVEDEVSRAFAEERTRKQTVLVPIRIDEFALKTAEPWATKLRDQRHIGDFTRWRDVDFYRRELQRLIQDLAVGNPGGRSVQENTKRRGAVSLSWPLNFDRPWELK